MSAARIKEIIDAAFERHDDDMALSLEEADEICGIALRLERAGDENVYRETCKAAQARGTVKHEQLGRARNLLREARGWVGPRAGEGNPELIKAIDEELARSVD